MTEGYNYPDDSTKISGLLSPGYLPGAIGLDFKPNDNFTAFFAVFTAKITFVNDQALADAGAFGVEPGRSLLFALFPTLCYRENDTRHVTPILKRFY